MEINTNPDTRLRIKFVHKRHLVRFTKHMMDDPVTREFVEEVFDDSILFDLRDVEKRQAFKMGLLMMNKHIVEKRTKAGMVYLMVRKM